MPTAIITSDNHLGAYYARLRPDRLEERRRALQANFERVVDAALERHVDLFLHAGDLFDRPDPRNAERVFVARQVQRLREAGIPFFAIAGNHDSPRSFGYDGGTAPHEELEALGAIHLFRQTDRLVCETLTLGDQRVCVWGMSSDFNRPAEACPLQEIAPGHQRGGDSDDVNVVLLHYGVEGWAQPFALEPCLALDNLDRLKADAICVGHLHTRAERRLPGGALLLNPGATEHIHFGEEHLDCGYWVLDLKPGETQAEYVALATQPMRTLEVVCEPQPDADLLQQLLEAIEAASQPTQLLRVRLVGDLARPRFQEIDLNALQVRGAELNFHCQLDTSQLTIHEEFGGLPLAYGVSFDAGEELQATARALLEHHAENADEAEITRLAGRELAESYDRFTKGAR